jgi:DNA-binding CsgD family transcriptional regulator
LLLHDGLDGSGEPGALQAYLTGTYLLDPFYLACASRVQPGLYRMAELAPDAFFESDYVRSPMVHPCISMQSGTLSEEIGYLLTLPAGFMAALSLMRSNGSAPFAESDVARLRAVEPVVAQLVALHWRHLSGGRAHRGAPGEFEPEPVFVSFAVDLLTRQQQRIAQLLLRGHSNASVGRNLGISEATAKTHRKAIYERLGIGSQSELFALFVRHLLGTDPAP